VEVDLGAKGYSARDEKRILDVLGRGLLKAFPNPSRTGCPGPAVLKRIASHQMPLSEAEKWLDHLGSCSPCYRDFLGFQASYRTRRVRTVFAIAAGILIVASLFGWALARQQKQQPLIAQNAVVDLRNRSAPRGGEPNPDELPLKISRKARHLNVYLPLGSPEGPYEVRIATTAGGVVFNTTGAASLKEGTTSIEVGVDLSSASSGQYVLQFRRPNSEWNSYALKVQ
jgi:hypothetical protein